MDEIWGLLGKVQERLEITGSCEFAQEKFNESQLKLTSETQATQVGSKVQLYEEQDVQ